MTHMRGPRIHQLECHLMNLGERQPWGGRGLWETGDREHSEGRLCKLWLPRKVE